MVGEDDEIETGFTGRPNDLRLAAHGVVGTLCVDAENAGGPDTRRRERRDSKRIRLDGRLGGDPVDAGQNVSTRQVEDDQGELEDSRRDRLRIGLKRKIIRLIFFQQ